MNAAKLPKVRQSRRVAGLKKLKAKRMKIADEKMQDGADEQEHPRQRAEEVRPVLLPEEEDRDRGESAESQPQGDPERRAPRPSSRHFLHAHGSLPVTLEPDSPIAT